ncbi:MAG: molecular chaperone TorD family protein [Alphaproteobacteria bacterium]|nr:molecular chaperone TorD family protein [Alphaproteobacteria bacterium]
MTERYDPRALALARGRALDLLSGLFLRGPEAERLEALRAVAALAPALEDFDADAAAADHHEVLQRQLFPFASVFLSADGQLGGPESGAARDMAALCGARVEDEEPDHLGVQLGVLRHLAGAEVDAWSDGREDEVARVQDLARHVMDRQLLRWLPALVVALQELEHPLYTPAGLLTLELVGSWRAELGEGPALWSLPEPPELLDDPKTGLKRIAQTLSVPALAGVFLTQGRLRRLGRALELPQGFGKRWQLLENLLATAVQYGQLPAFLETLEAALASDRLTLRQLDTHGALPIAPWLSRLEASEGLLRRMREAAQEA